MRNFWLSVVFVGAAAGAAFAVGYATSADRDLQRATREVNPVVWLRNEFRLSEAQFAEVRRVHDEFMRVCQGHCDRILAARARTAPASELQALEDECVAAMRRHFERVAALLPAGEGPRYLSLVLPRIADYDHAAAPSAAVR